jgi:hypothetical protein
VSCRAAPLGSLTAPLCARPLGVLPRRAAPLGSPTAPLCARPLGVLPRRASRFTDCASLCPASRCLAAPRLSVTHRLRFSVSRLSVSCCTAPHGVFQLCFSAINRAPLGSPTAPVCVPVSLSLGLSAINRMATAPLGFPVSRPLLPHLSNQPQGASLFTDLLGLLSLGNLLRRQITARLSAINRAAPLGSPTAPLCVSVSQCPAASAFWQSTTRRLGFLVSRTPPAASAAQQSTTRGLSVHGPPPLLSLGN